MNKLFAVVAWGALLWLALAAVGCFAGWIDVEAAKPHFLGATIAWFVAAPLGSRRR